LPRQNPELFSHACFARVAASGRFSLVGGEALRCVTWEPRQSQGEDLRDEAKGSIIADRGPAEPGSLGQLRDSVPLRGLLLPRAMLQPGPVLHAANPLPHLLPYRGRRTEPGLLSPGLSDGDAGTTLHRCPSGLRAALPRGPLRRQ